MSRRMTKKRLKAAINFLNPETGLIDLVNACVLTISNPLVNQVLMIGDGNRCVLAHAWKDGHNDIRVSGSYVKINTEKTICNNPLFDDARYYSDGIIIDHPYEDVVSWFDRFFGPVPAAREILRILGYAEDGTIKSRVSSKKSL